jgi:hypothetical protein
MIDIQLARRNLTPEQKSYLRGQRYQREKTAGHGDQSALNNYGQTTAERRNCSTALIESLDLCPVSTG